MCNFIRKFKILFEVASVNIPLRMSALLYGLYLPKDTTTMVKFGSRSRVFYNNNSPKNKQLSRMQP